MVGCRKSWIAHLICIAPFLSGCQPRAQIAANSNPEPAVIDVQQMKAQGSGQLRAQGYAPGWIEAEVLRSAAAADPFRMSMAPGRILQSATNPEVEVLTLSGVILPAVEAPGQAPALIPVALLNGRLDDSTALARPTAAGAALGKNSFQLTDHPAPLELFRIADYVSSPDRAWRPELPDAIVAPHDFRHLNRQAVGANGGAYDRARQFFAERAAIQTAIWMRLWDFEKSGLESQLVFLGPGLEPLSGPKRDAALRAVVRNAFTLWVAMGFNPQGSRLAADYPAEAEAAVRNRRTPPSGAAFPGAASPLAPVLPSRAEDLQFLNAEGLLARADFAP